MARSSAATPADRCGNEVYMLKFIDKLVKKGALLEILLSNHGLKFIRLMEEAIHSPRVRNIYTQGFGPEYESANRLATHINENEITLQEVKDLYENYITTLKAFSYDYSDEGKLIIYGHAPMSELDILDIAEQFSI